MKTSDYLFCFLMWYAPKIINIIPQIHKIKCIIVEVSGFASLNTKENAKIIIPKITNTKPLYFIFSSSQSFLNILFYYNIFGGKKTSDYFIYEAIFPTSWLLHVGQTYIVLSDLQINLVGSSKIVLQFLQWKRIICYSLLLCYVIYFYITYNNILIYILMPNFYWLKTLDFLFGGFN